MVFIYVISTILVDIDFIYHLILTLFLILLDLVNSFHASSKVFRKKSVIKNFPKFTEKHLCHSLLVQRPQACNFIKKETLAHVLLFVLLFFVCQIPNFRELQFEVKFFKY